MTPLWSSAKRKPMPKYRPGAKSPAVAAPKRPRFTVTFPSAYHYNFTRVGFGWFAAARAGGWYYPATTWKLTDRYELLLIASVLYIYDNKLHVGGQVSLPGKSAHADTSVYFELPGKRRDRDSGHECYTLVPPGERAPAVGKTVHFAELVELMEGAEATKNEALWQRTHDALFSLLKRRVNLSFLAIYGALAVGMGITTLFLATGGN